MFICFSKIHGSGLFPCGFFSFFTICLLVRDENDRRDMIIQLIIMIVIIIRILIRMRI